MVEGRLAIKEGRQEGGQCWVSQAVIGRGQEEIADPLTFVFCLFCLKACVSPSNASKPSLSCGSNSLLGRMRTEDMPRGLPRIDDF